MKVTKYCCLILLLSSIFTISFAIMGCAIVRIYKNKNIPNREKIAKLRMKASYDM